MFKSLTVLACLGVMLYFGGCADRAGEGPDEFGSVSIEVPTAFPSILTPEVVQARVTITAPDMSPLTYSRDIVGGRPPAGTTREVTIDGIPVGPNRTVTVEILLNGEVYFDGSAVVNLVSGGNNHVLIALREVYDDGPIDGGIEDEIIGTWILTNTENAGLILIFEEDGSVVSTWDDVNFLFGVYTLIGNQIVVEFLEGVAGGGTVSIDGDQMTISSLDGTVEIYERLE